MHQSFRSLGVSHNGYGIVYTPLGKDEIENIKRGMQKQAIPTRIK